MRFTVEQRQLTDPSGRPLGEKSDVSFHTFEADSADEVVRLFVKTDGAEVIGSVLVFPGFQAVATVRNPTGVYTLQVAPTSQQIRIKRDDR